MLELLTLSMISPGEQIGRYKIRSAIGKGGMGEVFLADDTELERLVALKVLPVEVADDSERLRRFAQEAKAVSALNHPNIITIYEIGKTDNTHFIATEYIEGETLHSRLKSEQMNLKSALEIAIQVASALDAAHRAGIVHRDIKPENVMIRPDGLVKILDFGIAKLTEKKVQSIDAEAATAIKAEGTSPGMIIGTASYMSPEQAKGKPIDARSDIFSFGVVLYEMLSGKPPFEGENAMDVIGSILNKEPAPIQQLIAEVPQEIGRIISKTLKKDREERYQTAKDLLIDLKDVKQDLELQNKLERTAAPNQEEPKTQILNATTNNAAQTTSSAEYVVSEIKSHKSSFAIGLIVLILASVGLGYWFFTSRSSSTKRQIESIAVLPFINQSGNADNEYLSDGMTETLINSLSQLPNLTVKARSSVFSYKGKEVGIKQIGNELFVQAILNGRIAQRGDNITLGLELVDAQTGNQIWGEQYNRKMNDIVSLQSEIARDVSQKLRTRLSGADEQKLTIKTTANPEAYQLYLQGRYHWNKRKPEEHKKAIEYFERAIELDPNYALAYAGLADCYAVSSSPVKGQEKITKLRAAANKALELDSSLGEPHAALANSLWSEWDWSGVESEYKRAIQLSPNYASAHQWYGELLSRLGRHDEAISEIKRARELDPLSLIINSDMIHILSMAQRYDEAIEQGRRTLEMDASWNQARYNIVIAYAFKGMYEESLAEEEKALEFSNQSPEKKAAIKLRLVAIREAYGKSGARGYWQKTLEFVKQDLAKREEVAPFFIAEIYANLGDKNEGLKWLEKAVEERDVEIDLIKVYPAFDSLRSDPRFTDLMRRVGLPQ